MRQRVPGARRLPCMSLEIGLLNPKPGSVICATPPFKIGDRIRKLPLLNVGANDSMGAPKVRFHGLHGAKLINGPVILVRKVEDHSIIGGDDGRDGIEVAGPLALRKRLLEAPLKCQTLGTKGRSGQAGARLLYDWVGKSHLWPGGFQSQTQ